MRPIRREIRKVVPESNKAGAPNRARKLVIVTVGVYGSDERAFFDALQEAAIDTFCDLRFRRGVRGAEYAFVNAKRLEARLSELGIRYLHLRDLAPSAGLRARQYEADREARIAKRRRAALSPSFIRGYTDECLRAFDSQRFLERLGSEASVVALFCVERAPEACHRSLLAARLQEALGLEVVHLTPG